MTFEEQKRIFELRIQKALYVDWDKVQRQRFDAVVQDCAANGWTVKRETLQMIGGRLSGSMVALASREDPGGDEEVKALLISGVTAYLFTLHLDEMAPLAEWLLKQHREVFGESP